MQNNNRLGQGLSGLIARNTVNIIDNQQEFLPISSLYPGKFQPRIYFSEESLKELASSIEKNGIIQPIIVRKNTDDSKYEIIAGERRWQASKIAGLNSVPVIIRDLDDKKCLEILIIENIQRANISPIDEGEAYKKLIDEFSYTHKEIALIAGKSRSYISNIMRLLSLLITLKQ
nr:ParB/RepB/Spo0J family partition protein [Wolbachia pipientis]